MLVDRDLRPTDLDFPSVTEAAHLQVKAMVGSPREIYLLNVDRQLATYLEVSHEFLRVARSARVPHELLSRPFVSVHHCSILIVEFRVRVPRERCLPAQALDQLFVAQIAGEPFSTKNLYIFLFYFACKIPGRITVHVPNQCFGVRQT